MAKHISPYTPIADSGLKPRAAGCLGKNGITVVGLLILRTESEIKEANGMGPKLLGDILSFLGDNGLRLRQDHEDPNKLVRKVFDDPRRIPVQWMLIQGQISFSQLWALGKKLNVITCGDFSRITEAQLLTTQFNRFGLDREKDFNLALPRIKAELKRFRISFAT